MFAQPGVRLATSYYSDQTDQHEAITLRNGSHVHTKRNIVEALRRSIPLRVGLIDVGDGQRVKQAHRELTVLGVTDTGIDRLRQVGRGARDVEPDVSQLCGHCARGKVAVSNSGDVWPCVFARWMPLGNVRSMPLGEVVTVPRMRAVQDSLPAVDKCSPESRCDPAKSDCNPHCPPGYHSEQEVLALLLPGRQMTSDGEDQRDWMREQLRVAAEHFSLRLVGPPVFGWRARTIGSRASNADGDVWLRVSWAEPRWAEGNYWTGNQEATAIIGVPKPTILDLYEWAEEGYFRNRAEVMSLVHDEPCSGTQELREELTLPAQWWHSLRDALDVLSQHHTERTITSQEKVSRRLLAFFGDQVNPEVDRWATAHGDLNWSNVTTPNLNLLDWESFGLAPVGYDAATLYVLSLRAPATAAKVRETFADVLESPDGVRSQLHVIGRFLKRVELGDFTDMAGMWHRHARGLMSEAVEST